MWVLSLLSIYCDTIWILRIISQFQNDQKRVFRKGNTPFPIATRHTLQWLKAEQFSWESCLCAKLCKQCIVQIRSQTGHLFAVCLFTAKWDLFSPFWIYLDTTSGQHYHIASSFWSNLYLLGIHQSSNAKLYSCYNYYIYQRLISISHTCFTFISTERIRWRWKGALKNIWFRNWLR